jgi:hypothetical protein
LPKGCTDASGSILRNGVAGAANQEHRPVFCARVCASDEGVHPFKFVRKSVAHQKFQRAVGNGWMRRLAFLGKPVQYVIGTKCAMFFQQNLQDPAADWGKAQILVGACGFDLCCSLSHAAPVVMAVKGDRLWRSIRF